MKKSLWLVLVLMLVCILALSACDNGTGQLQNPDTEQSTNQPSNDDSETTDTDNTPPPSTDNTECQHAFGEWITIKEATCKENGEEKHICSQCSAEEKRTIDKTNVHIEVVDSAVAPTCTKTGLTEGKHCSVCNTVITAQTTISALEHTVVVDVATESTCKTNGKTEGKHCSVCDIVIVEQITIPLANHTYDSDEDEKCNICEFVRNVNCKHTETVTLKAIAPTCTASGLTEGKKCSKCEEILVAQTTVGALGHVEVIDNAAAATCTTNGKTEGKHCSRCNTTLVAQTTVGALGHVEVIDNAVAATCTTNGKTEGKHCSRCNTTLVAQTIVGALGHANDSICAFCGYNTLEYAGGIGTEQNPYLISTAEHMRNVGKHENAYYKMISDIDFSNANYSCGNFKGTFDGNNHKIYNLRITNNAPAAGLFVTNYGTIKNVRVVNSSISAISNQNASAGAIAAENYGTIINCHNINTEIHAETNHDTWQKHSYAGGIAGRNTGGGIISKCSNTGSISAYALGTYSNTAFWSYAGGIVGLNYESTISDCYSISSICADSYTTQECSTVTLRQYSGGIAGANPYSSIIRTYSNCLGCTYGIALNDTSAGYYVKGTIKDSYYTFSAYGGSGATRISPAELEQQATFVGFDFDNVWIMGVADGSMCPIFKTDCVSHNPVKVEAEEANCTTWVGNTEGSYCSSCLAVIEPFYSIYSSGHSFNSENVCTTCQVKDDLGIVYQINDSRTAYSIIRFDNTEKTDLEIPGKINGLPVTSINSSVFAYFSNLKTVIIPNTITEIGTEAFYSCKNLVSINIPSEVAIIYEKTFGGCEKLINVYLSDGLKIIEEYAFGWCYALETINIPNTVVEIQENAFYACRGLKKAVIPKNTNDLYHAFYGADNVNYYLLGNKRPSGLVIYTSTKCYYYSEKTPSSEGNYWHYVDGVPTVWK